jgi:hypothetical protein
LAAIGEGCGNWQLLGIARAIEPLFLARMPDLVWDRRSGYH